MLRKLVLGRICFDFLVDCWCWCFGLIFVTVEGGYRVAYTRMVTGVTGLIVNCVSSSVMERKGVWVLSSSMLQSTVTLSEEVVTSLISCNPYK